LVDQLFCHEGDSGRACRFLIPQPVPTGPTALSNKKTSWQAHLVPRPEAPGTGRSTARSTVLDKYLLPSPDRSLLRPLPSFSSPRQCTARLIPPRRMGSSPCPPFFVALLEPRVASPAAGASPAPLSPSSAFLVARRWRFLRFALFIGYSFWPSLILPRAVTISLALVRDTEVVLPLLYPAKSPPFARAADLARLPG
jgi:hypothetical protein